MPRRKATGDCALCPYSMDCPDYKDDKSRCTVSIEPTPKLDTPEDIRNLQQRIVSSAVSTLQRGERLAKLGLVDLGQISDLRKQVFMFTRDMLKDKGNEDSGAPGGLEKYGLDFGDGIDDPETDDE